jgi:hypothetical protein
MQRFVCLGIRPLALVLVALAALFGGVPDAHAQREVTSPMTTKRLERLLAVYVVPTPEEAAAIDRLHEAYLADFLAKVNPQIDALRPIAGAPPSPQEFEQFLSDLDRLQAKIVEVEDAFFAGATDVLAEARRPGMQRVREARERQRNVSGFSRMGFDLAGGLGRFVDLADLLARAEIVREVPEASRGDFDALLLAQEQRLLAQSRSFARESRKACEQWFAALEEQRKLQESVINTMLDAAEAGADGGAAEEAVVRARSERMQRMNQMVAEAASGVNRATALNADSNRAALPQFATVLPELLYHRLRGTVARRSMGALDTLVGLMGGHQLHLPGGGLEGLLERLRRDPAITAEMRERLVPIELTWYRESADNIERLAKLTSELNPTTTILSAGDISGGTDEARASIRKIADELSEIDQRAYRAVAAVIGSEHRAVAFTRPRNLAPAAGANGGDTEALAPNMLYSPEVDSAATEVASSQESDGLPSVWTAAHVARILKPLGVSDSSLAVIEGVVEAWTAREWAPKVAALQREFSHTLQTLYVQEADGRLSVDRGKSERLNTLRLQIADAIFAADASLFQDLAASLGLGADSAEMLLLRLERVSFVKAWVSIAGSSVSASSASPSPGAILVRAGLSPEESRAFLENTRDAWQALAAALPSAARALIEYRSRAETAMSPAADDVYYGSSDQLIVQADAAMRAFARRYGELCDVAAAKASEKAEVAASIRRARLSLARPDVYEPSECATGPLESALAINELSAEQRARLEALMAEYAAAYESLSEKIASGPTGTDTNGHGTMEATQQLVEFEQRLRLQRSERTEKARSEARRILGDELASRVRGLESAKAEPLRTRMAQPFGPAAEDD